MLFSAKAANATSLKEVIVTANKVRCTFHLQKTAEKLAKHMGEGSSQVQAWNEKVQADLIRCAHMFFYAYLFENAYDVLDRELLAAPATKQVVEQLVSLYGLFEILEDLTSYLQTGYFTAKDIDGLRDTMRTLLAETRKNAIVLVDAFGHEDHELASVLGCYDGNVYERLLDIVRKNPLNKVTVPRGYNEYMRPFKRAKL